MTNSKVIVIAALGLAASLLVYHQSAEKFREREMRLRAQGEQLVALSAEHQRLSNLIATSTGVPAEDHSLELARLRRESEALKKQMNGLVRPLVADPQPRQSPPARPVESHSPEYWEELHQRAGRKPMEARDLSRAFCSYAWDHQGQCPSNLDQLTTYLEKNNLPLSGTNRFEIVYQGSLDQLDGIPLGDIVVIRDSQTWPAPDGKMMRIYGMGGGVGRIMSSDDNFQSWEAQHIIPPPRAEQTGR